MLVRVFICQTIKLQYLLYHSNRSSKIKIFCINCKGLYTELFSYELRPLIIRQSSAFFSITDNSPFSISTILEEKPTCVSLNFLCMVYSISLSDSTSPLGCARVIHKSPCKRRRDNKLEPKKTKIRKQTGNKMR